MKLFGRSAFKEFRNRALIRATAAAVRLLFLTIRIRSHGWERAKLEGWHGAGAIFTIWHNTLMLPLGHESHRGCQALVSAGRDGEFAAQVIARFGVGSIRGGTSKRAVGAVLETVRLAGRGRTFALTPDGPRGPRYRFQAGAAWLAARTGLPVIPLGIAVSRSWKLRSWDRFRIPKPFAAVHFVFGTPVLVRAPLDGEGLEAARAGLESALAAASKEASRLAGVAWPD